MREPVSPEKIQLLMRELGRRVRGPGRVYLVGGASALLEGWRATTVDVDLKPDPEPAGFFEAVAVLKNELGVNVELASPDQFLPPLPGWKDRSVFLCREGEVDFFHYDFRAQALAKLARGLQRDLDDVRAMAQRGLIEPAALITALAAIRSELPRYPALDGVVLEQRVQRFAEEHDRAGG